MKLHQTLALLAVSSSLSLGAIADEYGSHKQGHGASKYDCEAVHKMDHSKMDMNDPKMQEMMKVCGGHGHQNNHGEGQHNQNHQKGNQHHNGHGGHGQSGHHG